MRKWEYNIIVLNHSIDTVRLTRGPKEGILEFLDERGMDGWEVIAVEPCDLQATESRVYLKRPVEEE
jgi:hypothetical protein